MSSFLGQEFWLGLDNMYQLTQSQDCMLRIKMESFDGVQKYAMYDHFKITENVSK